MRKILFYGTIFIFIVMLLSVVTDFASADSWWGYGARRPDWVLSHGGTIIRFEIEDTSGEDNEYKAVMYDADGDYVEKEFGVRGLFDDAKKGVYVIKAVRGEGNLEFRTSAKGGKKFAEIKVTAHPGETMKIKFNYKKKTAKMTTDYFKLVPKPVINPAPTSVSEQAVEEAESPESNETQANQVTTATDNDDSLIEVVEEFVHPDALAKEIDEHPSNSESEESVNVFERIWNFIRNLFSRSG